MPKKKKIEKPIGLVLSGGSLTGIASHLGVLNAIDEAQIQVDYLVGTSAGAIIGGLYCKGISPLYLLNLVRNLKKKDLVKFSLLKFFRFGTIFSNKKLRKIIETELKVNSWLSLNPKFACVAVNLSKGVKEVIKGGCRLADAMLASSAIPFVFEPVKIGDDYYCDGGGISNIPIKEMVDIFPDVKTIIVSSLFDWDTSDNIYQSNNPFKGSIFTRTYNVLSRYLKAGARELLTLQDLTVAKNDIINIDLRGVTRIGLFNFEKVAIPFQQAKAIAEERFR